MMTADDARWDEATAHHVLAEADHDVAAHGDVSGDQRVVHGPDRVRRNTSGRLAPEDTSFRYWIYGMSPARPDAGDQPSARPGRGLPRGTDVEAQDLACCPTCSQHLLVEEYAAERDRARADLLKIRHLVERHLTTHGYYADRRLKEWYDATATPRSAY